MEHLRPENRSGNRGLPLWQRVWLDSYPCDVPSSLPYPNVPVTALLETAAQRFADHPACTIYGQAATYSQLADQARRLARSLADLGAGPGRRVAMLLPNIPEYLVALQATWLTGATALQLSPLMVAEEIARWIETTDCHLVVTLDLLAPMVQVALERGPLEHVVVASLAKRLAPWRGWLYRLERLRRRGPFRLLEKAHLHPFDHLLRVAPRPLAAHVIPEDDVAVLVPTGGTTAAPKVVMLTHRNLVANAMQVRAWSRGEDASESVLGVLPFFHAYGLTVCMLSSYVGASTVHLHPRFETKAVLNLLERYRIELVPAVPALLGALNRSLARRPRDLSFIRVVVSGASALDPTVRAAFQEHAPCHIVEGYGLTEAGPCTHVNPVDERNRPGTIGLPLPDTEARIVDQATGSEELPNGAVGELIIRGPQVMKGYYNNPEETALALRDGWLYTGDLAKRDADGFFTIVDRKKDIIKTSGFLVIPAEVEEVLRAFPGVAEAAVIGVPDADRGEVVKAMIVRRDGIALDLEALNHHCTEHLSKHKRPRRIEIVDELPKNFLGKIQRRRLREATSASEGNGQCSP
jgi:long-chain acyl-CoA synthetase